MCGDGAAAWDGRTMGMMHGDDAIEATSQKQPSRRGMRHSRRNGG